ncbi:MAG: GNAT family N-acetyltransferase [Anaerolineae bacterium]|nr:GNAT family N-acetyltransferase [Anaerolineae bacterium]
MKVTAYANSTVFEQLKPVWNDLLQRSISNLIFLSWEWQSIWWNAYQAGDLWVLTVTDEQDKIIAIAPWFVQNRSDGRVVRTIGCVDVTDYVDIIVEADKASQVYAVLAAYIRDHNTHFDWMNLCNIPESSPTYSQFPDALRKVGLDADLILQEVCPVIHLPNDWEAYLGMLDKKNRHELRRKVRRAESESNLEYYILGAEHNFESEVDVFLNLMRASQPAKAEFLAVPENEAFFRSILHATFEKRWLRLSFLKVDGVPAAAYCDFDYNGEILVYNSGLDPDVKSHLSTGIVLLVYNIQAAIKTGHRLYDFLRGNETYKYRMGAQDTCVYKMVTRKREAVTVA